MPGLCYLTYRLMKVVPFLHLFSLIAESFPPDFGTIKNSVTPFSQRIGPYISNPYLPSQSFFFVTLHDKFYYTILKHIC